MSDPTTYPDFLCWKAPLKPEVIPDGCDCVVCKNRKAFLENLGQAPMIFRCPVCLTTDEAYYGRLVFPSDQLPLFCPNHRAKVELRRV